MVRVLINIPADSTRTRKSVLSRFEYNGLAVVKVRPKSDEEVVKIEATEASDDTINATAILPRVSVAMDGRK